MILTESIKNVFETVLKNEAQAEKLIEEAKKARASIRAFLEEAGETSIKQDGYYANIATGSRSTLQKAEVQKLLGYEIPSSCFKTTQYTTLTIKRQELV